MLLHFPAGYMCSFQNYSRLFQKGKKEKKKKRKGKK